MADSSIDQIIAGGAGASTRADFSKLAGLLDYFYKGQDQAYQQEGRNLFKGGVPQSADGSVDYGAMRNALFQHGDVSQGVAVDNLDLQRQGIQQNREGANYAATGQTGGVPQQSNIVSPPSTNGRLTPVAPALGKGGAAPGQRAPQGDQPGSIVGLVSAAGVPDELAGPIIQQVSAMTKMDPNAALSPDLAPRVQQVVQAAAQRMKGGQAPTGMPPQAQPQAVPQQPMQQPVMAQGALQPPPQAAPQAPSPFQNAVAAGLIPQGVDPTRYVAGLKYRAAALPKGPAQELIQSQVNAIDKASELTQTQRDYNASRANPKMDEYATQQEAAKTSAKGVAEADVKEQNDTILAGKQATQRLATLNTLSNIVSSDKGLTLGFGADTALKAKMALKQLGIDVGDLSGAEAIQKLNASLASESAKAISARPAQFEFKTFLSNNPGLSLDKEGNQRVIGIFSQLAKRDVDLGRLARANRDNWDNWDNVVQQYDKQNPIKDPSSGRVITTDSVVAPGPAKSGGSALPTPKAGDIINGHIFRGGDPKIKASWAPVT
jgi:hypothetical protein